MGIADDLKNISESFNDYYHSKCRFKNFGDNKILIDFVKMKILESRISEVRILKDFLDLREKELFDALQEIEKEVLGCDKSVHLRKAAGVNMNPALEIQPEPIGNGIEIIELVKQDLVDRAEMGEKKYGEKLKPFNGRSALVDAYQEALDLCMYLRQAIYEADYKSFKKSLTASAKIYHRGL